MSGLRTLVCSALAALAMSIVATSEVHAQAAAPASAIPVVDFFKLPAVRSPMLSPSGKKIAMIVPAGNDRLGLGVASIDTPDKFVGIAKFEDADVGSINWVNDDRLVFTAIDYQAPVAEQRGSGLYAVNADGSDFLWLIEQNSKYRPVGVPATRPLSARHRLFGVIDGAGDDVIVERLDYFDNVRVASSTLLRLNTRDLTVRPLNVGEKPSGAQGWVLDRQIRPRVATSYEENGIAAVHWRPEGGDDWVKLFTFDVFNPEAGTFTPVALDFDGQLFVSAVVPGANPEGTSALYKYDPVKKAIDAKPLVSVKGFDFDGQFVFDRTTRTTLGVQFTSDAPGTVWFDAGLKSAQDQIDKLLPGTVNIIQCRNCAKSTHLIVTAMSDRQSPVYFLFDRGAGKLRLVGASRPWLDSARMAEQDMVRIKARDGMELPVYVTKPKGKGPWPTVVMVHGGPFVRGHEWGFHPDNQFLASRGYLVVEVEFRGSRGYGSKLFRAGWKQWGLTMQDDVTDATKWAVQQGLADAKRMAIAGGSYGGYAAMMGLLKEPELYRAGINLVGVTDIALMYEVGWSDFIGDDWMRFGMPRMIGDPKKDEAQLTATSPLKNAARIKQPVLMAYGEQDLRVPLPHGTRMRDALIQSGNRQVEWIQYANEGHGFMLLKNNVDLWSRIERFLGTHLK